MARPRHRSAFSLVELVIVIAITAILASLLLPALGTARDSGRNASCLANLRQIGIAVGSFQVDYERYPSSSPRSALRRYMPSASGKAFLCPFDEEPELGDSYSAFYCPRWARENTTGRYVLSCPRHGFAARRTTIVLFTLGEAAVKLQEPTEWNGYPAVPGMEAVGGVFHFADGSSSTLSGAHRARFVSSFDIGGGRSYSVLKVEDGVSGSLDNSVAGGSQFEVVTPAAVVGVEGTTFDVTTFTQGAENIQYTRATVSQGSVRATGFDGKADNVMAGKQAVMEGPSVGAIADVPGQVTDGVIYLRGTRYYRSGGAQGTTSGHAEYRHWDTSTAAAGKKIGEEDFRRDGTTGGADAGWYREKDTFAPND
jgi:prepilin-type N-terminal cleavage/methylation domain-containing protein